MPEITNKLSQNVEFAANYLRDGKLVAFPTETVYGLGADASNPHAIKQVFTVKGRPADHPLIVHIASAEQLSDWAVNIPASAWMLAKHFWPGPLTLILTKHPNVSELITGGQPTIALRVPNHPLTLALLKQFAGGIVGPSANKYGAVSPTTAQHVAADLNNEVAAILDGGACAIGIESTIVYVTENKVTIMRQGSIMADEIASVINCEVSTNSVVNAVRTSGSHESHYAPHTALHLLPFSTLLNTAKEYHLQQKTFSVISFQPKPANLSANICWQQTTNDPKAYAHDLYANLRAHDQLHNSAILIEDVPHNPAWAAIVDRLTRASVKK